MANTKSQNAQKEDKPLNLDTKVTLHSIADWSTGFDKLTELGEAMISPNGSIRLSRNEIIAQAQSGNKLISGTDGVGSHATLIIDDIPTRVELGFESENSKQLVLDEDLVKRIFDHKSQSEFESVFKNSIQTRAEKVSVMKLISKLGINDYKKIRFAEKYTGCPLE